jgi:hypothetical protein
MTSTTSSLIQTLVQLNNDGVDYLASGALDKAIDTLCQALAQARDLLSLRDSLNRSVQQDLEADGTAQLGGDSDEEDSSLLASSRGTSQQRFAPRELVKINIDFHRGDSCSPQIRTDDDCDDESEEASFSVSPSSFSDAFLFQAAYKVDTSYDELTSPSSQLDPASVIVDGDIQIVVTCLFFNLALTHIVWAIVDPINPTFSYDQCKSPSEYLLSAMKLYELAFSLLMQENSDRSDDESVEEEEHPQCEILALAIVNNLWWIHDSLGDQTKAVRCYEHLWSILMYLQERAGRSYNDNEAATVYGPQQHHQRPVQSTFQSTCQPFFATVTSILLKAPSSAPAA